MTQRLKTLISTWKLRIRAIVKTLQSEDLTRTLRLNDLTCKRQLLNKLAVFLVLPTAAMSISHKTNDLINTMIKHYCLEEKGLKIKSK